MIARAQLAGLAPDTDECSAPFWDALREGTLVLPRCAECRQHYFPPMPACPGCGSMRTAFETASGTGVIYSWVIVHRALHEAFVADVPYTILAVDLVEGPRLLGRLTEPGVALLAAGRRVEFAPYEAGGSVLPGFVFSVQGSSTSAPP